MARATTDSETKPRTCNACGETYEYPLPDSTATRFHCDNCAGLRVAERKAVERLNARVKKLERTVQGLEKKLKAAVGPTSGSGG